MSLATTGAGRSKGQNAVVPVAPTLLTATTNGSTRIDLAWTDNSDNETGFRIYRSIDGVTFTELDTAAADATAYSDTSCAGLTQYWYYVVAYNAVGESDPSNTDDATTTADIYIDYKNGNDTTGDGSSGTPYKTLTKALIEASNDDCIGVRGDDSDQTTYYYGTYSTSKTGLLIKPDTGHTPVLSSAQVYLAVSWSKTIGQTNVWEAATVATLGAFEGTTVLAKQTSVADVDSNENSWYYNAGTTYVHVSGGGQPSMVHCLYTATAMLALSGANITLYGLTSWWTRGTSFLAAASGISIKQCTIEHRDNSVALPAILVSGAGVSVDGCTFANMNASYSDGIQVNSGGTGTSIVNCAFDTVRYCVYLNDAGSGQVIEDCTFDNASHGIYAQLTSIYTARRCTATNTRFFSVCHTAGSTEATLHHCIYNWDEDGGSPGDYHIGYVGHGSCNLYHCIAANLNRCTTIWYSKGFSLYKDVAHVMRNCIAYNCGSGFVMNAFGDTVMLTEDHNCAYDNVDDWDGITPDGTSITDDPDFVSNVAGSEDFHLQAGSPCINAGVAIAGINDDYVGDAPDIGRYEYAAS